MARKKKKQKFKFNFKIKEIAITAGLLALIGLLGFLSFQFFFFFFFNNSEYFSVKTIKIDSSLQFIKKSDLTVFKNKNNF